ncbi:MAG: polymer-forming cytoskeletal protein [Ignavibacteriales bacterium]|nr:polymer-forming cytoskeletal protein [Ignavibacteriales bacterium]
MKFNNKKKMYMPISVISSDVVIRGEIEGACDMRFDGKLKGHIRIDGLLLIGKGAEIDGNLVADSIAIAGRVNGNAYATGKVEINPTGILTGDIKSKSLVIEEGGVYKGTVEDGAAVIKEEEPSVKSEDSIDTDA